MIIAGPPDQLNMEGFSYAKSWLESSIATTEVRGGDFPVPGWDSVAAVVMLAGYTEIPRLGVAIDSSRVPVSLARPSQMKELVQLLGEGQVVQIEVTASRAAEAFSLMARKCRFVALSDDQYALLEKDLQHLDRAGIPYKKLSRGVSAPVRDLRST